MAEVTCKLSGTNMGWEVGAGVPTGELVTDVHQAKVRGMLQAQEVQGRWLLRCRWACCRKRSRGDCCSGVRWGIRKGSTSQVPNTSMQ